MTVRHAFYAIFANETGKQQWLRATTWDKGKEKVNKIYYFWTRNEPTARGTTEINYRTLQIAEVA